jgi:hypothetical protein
MLSRAQHPRRCLARGDAQAGGDQHVRGLEGAGQRQVSIVMVWPRTSIVSRWPRGVSLARRPASGPGPSSPTPMMPRPDMMLAAAKLE